VNASDIFTTSSPACFLWLLTLPWSNYYWVHKADSLHPSYFVWKALTQTPNLCRSSLSGAACTPPEIFLPLLLNKWKSALADGHTITGMIHSPSSLIYISRSHIASVQRTSRMGGNVNQHNQIHKYFNMLCFATSNQDKLQTAYLILIFCYLQYRS
jgi:hypothetical protein